MTTNGKRKKHSGDHLKEKKEKEKEKESHPLQ